METLFTRIQHVLKVTKAFHSHTHVVERATVKQLAQCFCG